MGRWSAGQTLRDRFLEKVVVGLDHWLWTGATTKRPNGDYGVLLLRQGKRGNILAHRAAWTLYRGSIPNDTNVLHKCDLPRCVNPEHLFLGSQKDNMNDCKNKGRMVPPPIHRGESHHKAKLSAQLAESIRTDYANNPDETQRSLAGKYGVSQPVIGKVLRRESWVQVLK